MQKRDGRRICGAGVKLMCHIFCIKIHGRMGYLTAILNLESIPF